MLFRSARAHIAAPMTPEKDRRVPLSTEVSPLDLQLSACAIEGHQNGPSLAAERLRRETGRAQAYISPNTVRLAIGQLLGGRYRIERQLGEGGWGWCTWQPMSRCPERGSRSRF
jgi:hypothetical protein